MTQFFLQQRLLVDLVGTRENAVPEFQHLFNVLVDFVTACTAIVDRALLKQRILHGKRLTAELRRHNAALPVKVDERTVDAGNALVAFLVAAENALVVHGDEALKVRPVGADFFSQLFENLNALRTADGKQQNVAQLGVLLAVIVGDIAQALHKRLARGDDIADHQRAVGHHGQLAVFDIERHLIILAEHALTGHKADVMHADMLLVAAFLERVVECAAQNRQNVRRSDLFLLLEVVHHLRGSRHERRIHLVADNLRMVHQLAGLCLRDDVVFIDKAAARQTVAVHTLIAEFRYDMDVIPIFDHISFLPKKRDRLPFLRAEGPWFSSFSYWIQRNAACSVFTQHIRPSPLFRLHFTAFIIREKPYCCQQLCKPQAGFLTYNPHSETAA